MLSFKKSDTVHCTYILGSIYSVEVKLVTASLPSLKVWAQMSAVLLKISHLLKTEFLLSLTPCTLSDFLHVATASSL